LSGVAPGDSFSGTGEALGKIRTYGGATPGPADRLDSADRFDDDTVPGPGREED